MEEAAVIVQRRAQALWITLNRPEALNALTPDVVARMNTAFEQAEHDDEVRAVVLSARGRAFCAGVDLKFVRGAAAEQDASNRFLRSLLELLNRVERFPRPVIAAVNGLALAGGFELVLCCDIVLAASSAKFGDAHANYGLLPGGGGSVRLPRRIGSNRAKFMMFTAEFASAEAMAQAGLVNRIVGDEQLQDEAERLALNLAGKSPLALSRMKALVNDGLEQPAEVALRQELLMSALHQGSHDMQEGLAAFEEKRRPRFIGR